MDIDHWRGETDSVLCCEGHREESVMNSGLRGLLSKFFLQLCILEVELIQFKCDGKAGRKGMMN